MYHFTFYLILFASPCITTKKITEDDPMASSFIHVGDLPLYHAFGPNDEFTSRGVISFRNGKTATVVNNENGLTDSEMDKLERLVREDGLYFIRTPAKIGELFQDDLTNISYVSTFVKACYLYGSRLQDTITVSVDYAGNIIGLNIVSPKSSCTQIMDLNNDFNTTLNVHNQVPGAVPDTQTYVRMMEQQKAEQTAGTGRDNRSFIAKYWMYIVPVVLIFMFSAQGEPPAEGGGE